MPNLFLVLAIFLLVLLVGRWVVVQHSPSYSLRTKLLLALLGVVILSVLLVSIFNNLFLRAQLTAEVGDNLQELARSKAQAVGDWVAKEVDILEALSVNRVLQEGLEVANEQYTGRDTADIQNQLSQLNHYWQTNLTNDPLHQQILTNDLATELLRFRNQFPENLEILVTDSQGGLVAATNVTEPYQYTQLAWWQATYRQGRGSNQLTFVPETKELLISLPVYGLQSQIVVGVIRSRISLNSLLDILLFEESGRQQRVDLFLPDNTLFVPHSAGLTSVSIAPNLLSGLQQMTRENLPYASLVYMDEPGLVSQVGMFSSDPGSRLQIEQLKWQIIAHQPEREVFLVVNTALRTTIITGLGAMLLVGGLTFWLVQWLANPIVQLNGVIQQVAAGNLAARAIVYTKDEIGLLATTFNDMAGRLQQTLSALTQRTEMLQTSSEVASAASLTLDLDQVLQSSVALIGKRFGFYHTAIFIVESGSETAILRESYSHKAKNLQLQGYSLAIGSESLVGQATASQYPYIIENVASQPFYYPHPSLPETKAEAVFPLLVGGAVIGALDVQSDQLGVFTPDLVNLLKTLADQIAVAVQHAWLYQEQKFTADRLAELDRLKMQFLAYISHELRTPLNSIIGFSRLLLRGMNGPITAKQGEDLTLIYENGRHLLGIINSLLDLSKIEAGKLELVYGQVNVATVVEGAVATGVGLLKDKPIVLKSCQVANLPLIQADETRVKQILFNLVSNAVKFTPAGTIRVIANADQHWVTISVVDTGIGIPKEKLGEIFDEFAQVDSSNSRQFEGTGLGLPISKKLVELHGGRIWVESEPGQGSTFTFSLPIQPPLLADPVLANALGNGHGQLIPAG